MATTNPNKNTARNDSKAFEKKMTPDGFDKERDRELTTERGHLRGTFLEFDRFDVAVVQRLLDAVVVGHS